ncbi:TetR/AcrR family transcriptional regulator [Actinoplanes sp. DH11]|uniref:TetR/AcrR family transcriptional regulator n=1 Tax=Actinoplanes sp. DH11 TaxID=2857011 RepID=UPI001E29DE3E|nr:TetR/AcrR family transcriptional regulator [Actinoplanes sp. DH11]
MTNPRRRDAAATRQLLLDAARRRFAEDGYSATSVRDIATDAGVNVALISRYFTSKEGLFRACLRGTVDDLKQSVFENTTLESATGLIAEKVGGPHTEQPNQLLLLLRSSGDEAAEQIRLDTLGSLGRRLAVAAGGEPDDPELLLRAQLVLAAALGTVILRAARLQPLATAGQDELTGCFQNLVAALLAPAPERTAAEGTATEEAAAENAGPEEQA